MSESLLLRRSVAQLKLPICILQGREWRGGGRKCICIFRPSWARRSVNHLGTLKVALSLSAPLPSQIAVGKSPFGWVGWGVSRCFALMPASVDLIAATMAGHAERVGLLSIVRAKPRKPPSQRTKGSDGKEKGLECDTPLPGKKLFKYESANGY